MLQLITILKKTKLKTPKAIKINRLGIKLKNNYKVVVTVMLQKVQ